MRWDTAAMVMPDNALAADHAGIAITMIEKDDHWVLCWAVNISGEDATLPVIEAIAEGAAEVIRHYLNLEWHGEYGPDDGA